MGFPWRSSGGLCGVSGSLLVLSWGPSGGFLGPLRASLGSREGFKKIFRGLQEAPKKWHTHACTLSHFWGAFLEPSWGILWALLRHSWSPWRPSQAVLEGPKRGSTGPQERSKRAPKLSTQYMDECASFLGHVVPPRIKGPSGALPDPLQRGGPLTWDPYFPLCFHS